MDKVIFFKMGKFYELFEMDAHIGAKELGLQYMKGEQPHCGFPEKNFSMNVEKLARKGYRVLVVEQTETPEQMDLRRKKDGSIDKVVKREICAVVTKGTLTEGEVLSANPDASYLMAVTENSQNLANENAERVFGVCVVDVATSRVILGQFGDDLECSALSCLLSELRPVEIVKPANLLSPETEKVLIRHTRSPLVNELVPVLEFMDAERTVQEVRSIYRRADDQLVSGSPKKASLHASDSHLEEDGYGCLPEVLSEMVRAGENGISKGLPDVNSVIKHFKDAFDWVEANNSGRIIPHEGVDIEYDSACEKVKEIEPHLAKHLQEQRKLLGDKSHVLILVFREYRGRGVSTYVTVEKDSYLLEMPESLCSSIPSDYELRSSKKGFSRYWTPDIKKSLTELSLAETDKESSLKSILPRFIGRFNGHRLKWRQLVSVIAGQSTFLTELSETATMLLLVIHWWHWMNLDVEHQLQMDKPLESVLEHFIYKVQCRGMFSTHYHRLAVDYQNNSKVSLCHMACQVGNGDGGVEEVTFLYRLNPGACPKSYGVNIARLAGKYLCLVLLPY
ncbi:DNA mismatch repair protein MSH6 [Pyrus ussuriensis x Pyrus communis]|uniref:DNA mismatch repair protein MSH6 n=1 Tax=Pyrus ussuriensis x Pyrus communis TaxID=2448454 RepID=A0A5N5GNG8_9ROSA|nr:DNA mismatch repair protein MSH6 [Pyrus ussuriensis x Pyrus communis]